MSGVGAGAGTCFAWWRFAPNPTPFPPDLQPDHSPARSRLRRIAQLLQLQPVSDVLRETGSSAKLKPVFDNNETTIHVPTLLKKAPNAPAIRTTLFRVVDTEIEDTEIEPGKPNVVCFVAIVESHTRPDVTEVLDVLSAVATVRDDQGELLRPGLGVMVCSGRLNIGTYRRPVVEDDREESAYSDNSVIEEVNG